MDINLTSADVARLYGPRLFVIRDRSEVDAAKASKKPNPEAKTPVANAPDAEVTKSMAVEIPLTPAFTWKLKNENPKVIFFLQEAEFSNKPLTELLRKIVVASQVPTEEVGFAIIHRQPTPQELAEMPAPYGFLLDDTLNPFAEAVVEFSGKRIWFAKRLANMAKDDAHKADLWSKMKEFMQILRG